MPSCFKLGNVLPIAKTVPASGDPAKYRPITLLSVPGKVLESLMKGRIMRWLVDQDSLADSQHGFRKGRSSPKVLWELSDKWSVSQRNKLRTLAVSLDISKAYDMIWLPGLLLKMARLKFPRYIIKWVADFVSARQIRVRAGVGEASRGLTFGLPQGSPLSPVLFLIYINDLLLALEATGVTVRAFADDILLTTSGAHMGPLEERMNLALKIVETWSAEWRVTFNPTKCCAMEISRKRTKVPLQLWLRGALIPQVTEMRYLGVIFNHKLAWSDHVDSVFKKGKKWLGTVRKLVRRQFGCHPNIMQIFANTCLVPKLFYACESWASVTTSPPLLLKLDRVLARAIHELPAKIA
ncbi:hypothetical protein BSKO_05636 [Bryopsis sp. KO-2023]|nr:hypothetical protein BSKO_05636 [Bryopsis sp. KO-2023]